MEDKLYRSRYGTIAGVCTGIADYMKIEPLVVQVLFIALCWTPIPMVLIYIFLWIFMKKEPKF